MDAAKSCQRKKHDEYVEKIIFAIFKLNIRILQILERALTILFQTTNTFLMKYYTSSKIIQQDFFSCVFIQDLMFAKKFYEKHTYNIYIIYIYIYIYVYIQDLRL